MKCYYHYYLVKVKFSASIHLRTVYIYKRHVSVFCETHLSHHVKYYMRQHYIISKNLPDQNIKTFDKNIHKKN